MTSEDLEFFLLLSQWIQREGHWLLWPREYALVACEKTQENSEIRNSMWPFCQPTGSQVRKQMIHFKVMGNCHSYRMFNLDTARSIPPLNNDALSWILPDSSFSATFSFLGTWLAYGQYLKLYIILSSTKQLLILKFSWRFRLQLLVGIRWGKTENSQTLCLL